MNSSSAFEDQIISNFDISRYEGCKTLDERGWHHMLMLRQAMGDIDLAAPEQTEGSQAIMVAWVKDPLGQLGTVSMHELYLRPVNELTLSDAWGLRPIIERDERTAEALRRWEIRGRPRRAYPGQFWLDSTNPKEEEDARAALAGEWSNKGEEEAVVTSVGSFDEAIASLGVMETECGFGAMEPSTRCEFAHLKVSMSAPNDLLIEDFRRWLTERRKGNLYVQVPVVRFRETDFARWTSKRVLAYLDLKLAARCFGLKLPFHRYGTLLFPGISNIDSTEKVRKTIAPLAIKMLTDEFIQALEHAANVRWWQETGKH